jgi:hypothetical protein
MRSMIRLQLLQLVPIALCLIAAGVIYRQALGSSAVKSWRRHVAASIPAAYTLLLLLVWVLPIQQLFVRTVHSEAWIPLLALTLLGVTVGACLPSGYFRLRRAELNDRFYQAIGVRRFRSIVTYGDPMVRVMRRIDPESHSHLSGSGIADRERSTRRGEKIHWAMLLGSVPAAVWAIVVKESWFAVYLLLANVPMNIYPILLQRHTRARLMSMGARMNLRAESRISGQKGIVC